MHFFSETVYSLGISELDLIKITVPELADVVFIRGVNANVSSSGRTLVKQEAIQELEKFSDSIQVLISRLKD